MRGNLWFALGATLLLAAYAIASLYPFHPLRWGFPRPVDNDAELGPEGGLRFPAPGIARTDGPPLWVALALRSHGWSWRCGCAPSPPTRTGPPGSSPCRRTRATATSPSPRTTPT